MKCSLGIFNYLEEISSLSHSVVFLYLFALIAEEGFFISSSYSLELCIQMFISFLSFSPLFFSQLVDLFQILNNDAVKVLYSICQQVWKLSSGHRTGKGQFSFQFQRKAMPKNAQTTTQLRSTHMLVK